MAASLFLSDSSCAVWPRPPMSSDSPVHGQNHLLHTALDLVLGLQVSHALCGVAVDGQDDVTGAEVGLRRFAAGVHLRGQTRYRCST